MQEIGVLVEIQVGAGMSSDLRVRQVLCPDFTLALCLPIDGIVRNFFCFSFYWEFTRHTTFLVVSGSTH